MNLSVLAIHVAPEKIGFLKFILEAYDGLALMSTKDVGTGLVEIFYPVERHSELIALIQSLAVCVSVRDDLFS